MSAFVTYSYHNFGLIFASKAGAYPSRAPHKTLLIGWLLSMPKNISLVGKINTLAYNCTVFITTIQSLMVQDGELFLIKSNFGTEFVSDERSSALRLQQKISCSINNMSCLQQ